jgi:hypothetical protein
MTLSIGHNNNIYGVTPITKYGELMVYYFLEDEGLFESQEFFENKFSSDFKIELLAIGV